MTDTEIHALAAELAKLLNPTAAVPVLLTASQAGEMLGVPGSWMLAEARRDRVPHCRFGRYVRFSADELMAWVGTRSRGPRGPDR